MHDMRRLTYLTFTSTFILSVSSASATLVTEETRRPRVAADEQVFLPIRLEAIQGRFWCKIGGRAPASESVPTKFELTRDYSVENGTVAFENDIILLSRHMFLRKDGAPLALPENCFFEHIQSRKLYRVSPQAVYKPLKLIPGKKVDALIIWKKI